MAQCSVEYCEKCGGFIEWHRDSFLASNPPKYSGQCRDCKTIHTAFCSEVNAVLGARDEN